MKNYFVLLSVCICVCISSASAKNYYVSASGSNSNTGLSETVPWQTIAKVNSYFANMVAGDSILFKRGDIFYGALIITKSGSSGKPIVISAYGTGNKPVITGFVTASGWTNVSGNIYQAYIPGAKATLNMVTLNNLPQALGRYPNATDSNGGYLKYENFSGSTSITDNELTNATNWTGAEVAVRKKLWVIDRCKVTAHSGTTLTFTNITGSTYTGTANYGYFFQNDIRTLDQTGEWYFNNSGKYLQMYFGAAAPSSYTIKVSTLDTLLTMVSRSYININNLVFEGANATALYGSSDNFINIQDCDFLNAGTGAINITGTSNLLIENCTTNNILSNAILATCSKGSNITIRGCSVKNTAILPGMGLSSGNSYKGIVATALSNLLIEYNRVDTTGYVGIEFQGSNVNIQYNVVNYFDFVKDDAGGIYTYESGTDAAPGTVYTNRTISSNIVMNGAGAPFGRSSSTLFVSGIYLDGRTTNVSVLNNTVFNNGKNGIHCNNPNAVTIRGNTSFNNLNAMSVMRWASLGVITGLSIKNNTFYPKKPTQRCFYYTNSGLNEPAPTTLQAALTTLANIDSNVYNMANPVGFNFEIYGTTGGALIQSSPLSMEGWQAFSAHDINGKKPAKVPVSYKVTSLVGSNKCANGSFTSNITGVTVYGTAVTGTWDNTGKISGGSLRINFSSPVANKYNLIHSPMGAVSSAKQYILRFSTYGTTQQGIVRAYIRKTNSPYNNLVATQTKSFGLGKTDHEFLFNNPTTDAGGSFVIELEQNSGTTYIDNIEFYEATASLYDVDQQLRFEYNDTKIAKTVTLDTKYTGADGQVYQGTLTLQPFTSVILVKDTATVTTTVAARKASAAKIISAVGISESKPLHLNAYPNPAANDFNVLIDGGSNDRIALLVYSFDGKIMYQANGYSNTKYSFGNNFMQGVYILKVIQGNTTQTIKLVKAGK
jgi:Right handed beta helix region/Secretion system C-terminal sorting domain